VFPISSTMSRAIFATGNLPHAISYRTDQTGNPHQCSAPGGIHLP
jgi:hypothetical protein